MRNRRRPSFFIHLYQKEGAKMDSYDNDDLLMIMDDDLFPCEDEPKESER